LCIGYSNSVFKTATFGGKVTIVNDSYEIIARMEVTS
jgi:hypothetical protein